MATKRLLMKDAGGNQRSLVIPDTESLDAAVSAAAVSASAASASASAASVSSVASAASAVASAASAATVGASESLVRYAADSAQKWAALALRKAMDIAVSVASATASAAAALASQVAAAASAAAALASQVAAAASAVAAAASAATAASAAAGVDVPGADSAIRKFFGVPVHRAILAGTGILGGGNLSIDRTVSVNVGTGPSQIVQLDASSKLPAVDGSALINLPAAPATLDEGKIILFNEVFG